MTALAALAALKRHPAYLRFRHLRHFAKTLVRPWRWSELEWPPGSRSWSSRGGRALPPTAGEGGDIELLRALVALVERLQTADLESRARIDELAARVAALEARGGLDSRGPIE